MAWQELLADEIAGAGVEAATVVPDSRLGRVVLRLEEKGVSVRSLPSEEECLAYAAGYQLAGGASVVLMQNSGLGNAMNAIGSLVQPYGIGIPLVLSMRGTLGEANPSQIPIGRATNALLEAAGIQGFSIRSETELRSVASGVLRMAFEAGVSSAMILEPELGGERERN